MDINKGLNTNYKYTDYVFEKTTVRYVVMNEAETVFMLLFPNKYTNKICDTYMTKEVFRYGFQNNCDWFSGSIVHLHLSKDYTPMYDNSYKMSESTKRLKFESQKVLTEKEYTEVITVVKADEGYGAVHRLRNYNGENGFEVTSEFFNNTGDEVTLEMLTSANLDNLCMFEFDDGSKDFLYHTFKGGWATEGKHVEQRLSQMNMEKSSGGSFECEKIGALGSKTVGRYYPYAALEDTENNCTWGIKPKIDSTWQIELSRCGTPISLSAGIGDYKFGHWRKKVPNGGKYISPVAFVAVSRGGIAEVSNDLAEMDMRAVNSYGENGMPIIFNDWVTHRGNTSHDKLISIAKILKDTDVKYFVVDDGWQKGGVGDWEVDENKFPDGLKVYADEIRKMGMIPGIWMEFECVRERAKRWSPEYDKYYLTKDGIPINNAACNSGQTKFLDFRKKEVMEYLDNVVIKFLRENNIGYIKVDYNANIGLGCDGSDSLGDGLIEQMNGVYEFFVRIKEQIPGIIIENCSTGGSRLGSRIMSATAMSSYSDCIDSIEVPAIAANMHYLIHPVQNQIWCVLKENFDVAHMHYVISSGFLGRLCWSGNIDRLFDWQVDMLKGAEKFYEKVKDIIRAGRSLIYRTNFINNRKPQGTQAVVRYSKDKNRVLVVSHFFENAKELIVNLDGNYEITDSLYDNNYSVNGANLKIVGKDMDANVLVLTKKE